MFAARHATFFAAAWTPRVGNASPKMRQFVVGAAGVAAWTAAVYNTGMPRHHVAAVAVGSGRFGTLCEGAVAKPKDIVVICGPSGVGKGTIIKKLTEEFGKSQLGFAVSHTTRKPRAGEQHGVDYFFAEKELMEAEIAEGKFVESARVHANIYGTSINSVKNVTQRGKVCILDIDVQGAEAVKKSDLNARTVYIFVKAPCMAELEARLRGRGTETEEKIKLRMDNAKGEMSYSDITGFWTLVVTNDCLDAAVQTVQDTIRKHCDVR